MAVTRPAIQMTANTHHKGIIDEWLAKFPAVAAAEGSILLKGCMICTGIADVSGNCTDRNGRSIRGRKGKIQPAAITSQIIYRHFASYRLDKRGSKAIYASVTGDMETEHWSRMSKNPCISTLLFFQPPCQFVKVAVF